MPQITDKRTPVESTLTDRYQTTIPTEVRHALNLGKRDKIQYAFMGDSVIITRAATVHESDPVVGAFLAFLEKDSEAHPEKLQAVDARLVEHIRGLTAGVEIDLDAPLPKEDD